MCVFVYRSVCLNVNPEKNYECFFLSFLYLQLCIRNVNLLLNSPLNCAGGNGLPIARFFGFFRTFWDKLLTRAEGGGGQ